MLELLPEPVENPMVGASMEVLTDLVNDMTPLAIGSALFVDTVIDALASPVDDAETFALTDIVAKVDEMSDDWLLAALIMSAALERYQQAFQSQIQHSLYLFSDAVYNSLQVTCRYHWHDRRIHDSQILRAVDEQFGTDHTSEVEREHGTGAAGMVLCTDTFFDQSHDRGDICVLGRYHL